VLADLTTEVKSKQEGYQDRVSPQLPKQVMLYLFNDLKPVVTCEQVLAMQAQVRSVRVEPAVADYIVRLVGCTREDARLRLGISPRGSLALYRTAQATALMEGRDFVVPEDVRGLAVPVLAHRIVADTKAKYGGLRNEQIILDAMEKTAIPR
jgi:MoxR-like ATPase